MKKMLVMLLALAMTLCCAGAMAEPTVKLADGTIAKPCSDSYNGVHDGDYCLDEWPTMLTIHKSGLTVSDWTAGDAHIYLPEVDSVTLDNVHLENQDTVVYIQNVDEFTLNLKDTTLVGSNIGVQMQGAVNESTHLIVTGSGSITGSAETGIHIQPNPPTEKIPAICTLGGNLTVSGGDKAVMFVGGSSSTLNIDGKSYPGIAAEMSASIDGKNASAVPGSPFGGLTDVYGAAQNAKFIRTRWTQAPAAGDLPKTGDASMLGAWVCLLMMAGVGAMKMRRHEA